MFNGEKNNNEVRLPRYSRKRQPVACANTDSVNVVGRLNVVIFI